MKRTVLFLIFLIMLLSACQLAPKPAQLSASAEATLDVGDLKIHLSRLLVIGTALVLMLGLTYFVRSTRLGRAMRAVSMDLDAAQMMGVNVNQVILVTFFIGAVLAGGAGVLVGIVFFSIRHTMGFLAGLKGFTAAVVGGIGNIPGAALGGLLLGLAEAFTSVYISITFKDAIAFLLLLAILLVKPSGLLGRSMGQKV